MNVLIIEDEALAAGQIENYLKQIDSNLYVLGIIENVEDGVEWFESNPCPDLIISDIKLTDGLSFDIFSKCKPSCPIIFTTAYDQYAIKAFELNSIGYLLKPIDREKLKECIQKVRQNGTGLSEEELKKIARLIHQKHAEYKSRFLVKVGQKIRAISVDKIAYFYSKDRMTLLITRDNAKYPLDQSLEEIDNLLDPNDFFRINRKFLAHFEGIKEVHPYFKGRLKVDLTPECDEDIVVSFEKTPAFKAWLDK